MGGKTSRASGSRSRSSAPSPTARWTSRFHVPRSASPSQIANAMSSSESSQSNSEASGGTFAGGTLRRLSGGRIFGSTSARAARAERAALAQSSASVEEPPSGRSSLGPSLAKLWFANQLVHSVAPSSPYNPDTETETSWWLAAVLVVIYMILVTS